MTAKKQARVNPIHKNDKPPVRNDQCLQEIWHMLAALTERHASAHGELIEWLKSIDQRQVRMNNALKCVEQAVENKGGLEEKCSEEKLVWVIEVKDSRSYDGTKGEPLKTKFFAGCLGAESPHGRPLWTTNVEDAFRFTDQHRARKEIDVWDTWDEFLPKGYDFDHCTCNPVKYYTDREDEDDS